MFPNRLLVIALTLCLGAPALSTPAWAGAAASPAVSAKHPQATITREAARRVALARFPGGHVKSIELETENHVLLYSVDVQVRGVDGIEEVHVDARDGHVLSVAHETALDERAEAKAEGRKDTK